MSLARGSAGILPGMDAGLLIGAHRRGAEGGFSPSGHVEDASAATSRSQGPLLQVWVDHCERCGVPSGLFLVVASLFLCAGCSRERGLIS